MVGKFCHYDTTTAHARGDAPMAEAFVERLGQRNKNLSWTIFDAICTDLLRSKDSRKPSA
jgi:hypothetical protein